MSDIHIFKYSYLGSVRPYYHNTKTGETTWDPPIGYDIEIPPLNYPIPPPPLIAPIKTQPKMLSAIPRKVLRASKVFRHISGSARMNQLENQYLFSNDSFEISNDLLNKEYYPFDLLLISDPLSISNYFLQHTNQNSIDLLKKAGKKHISCSLNQEISQEHHSLSQSLFKLAYGFAKSNDNSLAVNYFRFLDDHLFLINESIFQFISEVNTIKKTVTLERFWILFLSLVSRYNLSIEIATYLRGFFLLVATHPLTSLEIQMNAFIGLFRLSYNTLFVQSYSDVELPVFAQIASSQTTIFGCSLSEILMKEHYESGPLVPKIFQMMISKLKELGPHSEGKASPTVMNNLISLINSGEREIACDNYDTILALTLYFLRALQQPLIPSAKAQSICKMPIHLCILLANSLANEQRDTLYYLVCYLRDQPNELVERFSGAIAGLETNTQSMKEFLANLIQWWYIDF